jgi:tetratricopeptide (TPR) repeat protein
VWDAAAATALVNSGRCQEALDQQINKALEADPNNALALDLKQKCTAPPPPPATSTVPVVTRTNAQKLDEAEASLQANACQAALDVANEVLAADANDERAKGVAKKATDCLKPQATQVTTASGGDQVVKIPPAQGGLEPQPGETGKEYKARVAAMRKRYEDAVALLQAQRFMQASREFEAISGVVPAGYLDLAQRRAELRSAMREESGHLYNAGAQAEQRNEWNTAIAAYQRAHDLDPGRDVTAEVARINEAKAKAGRQLCNEADAAFALSHNSEAGDKYSKVLELLPSSDPCYATAKERLAIIRK